MPPDIAIIDSGINPEHIHVGKISGGHAYSLNTSGRVVKHASFRDEIGHGTAIAGILRQKAPTADLYSIKIFQKDLTASATILMAALEWAIASKFRIIHLSLGMQVEALREKLISICQRAYDQGIVIIAAARSPQDKIYPAVFETVIGVFWDRECAWDQISYHPGASVEFGAHGWPRPLPGMPQNKNFRGNSFAVAHVTGAVAQLARQHSGASPLYLRNVLCRLADNKQLHSN